MPEEAMPSSRPSSLLSSLAGSISAQFSRPASSRTDHRRHARSQRYTELPIWIASLLGRRRKPQNYLISQDPERHTQPQRLESSNNIGHVGLRLVDSNSCPTPMVNCLGIKCTPGWPRTKTCHPRPSAKDATSSPARQEGVVMQLTRSCTCRPNVVSQQYTVPYSVGTYLCR